MRGAVSFAPQTGALRKLSVSRCVQVKLLNRMATRAEGRAVVGRDRRGPTLARIPTDPDVGTKTGVAHGVSVMMIGSIEAVKRLFKPENTMKWSVRWHVPGMGKSP